MNLRKAKRNWDELGRDDPRWVVLTADDKKGGKWDLDEFLQHGASEIDEVMAAVEQLGIDPPKGKALDFGCGVGRVTQPIAERVGEAHGVDISPSMIAKAREICRLPDQCHYHVNDKPDLGLFEDDTFDFIYSVIALQHIAPRYASAYIREFMRVLAPGGLLVFQEAAEYTPGGKPAAGPTGFRALLPGPVLRLLQRIKGAIVGAPFPRIEIHGMPRGEVEQLIQAAKGRVLDVQENDLAGPDWTSFMYFVTK